MKSSIVIVLTALALTGCGTMSDMMSGANTVPVTLTGAEEVPPVATAGSGSGSFKVEKDGSLTGSVTTRGVPGTMAHIHQGAKGQNGPVIVPLTKSGDTYSVPPGRKLTPAQMQALEAGNLYVNVHTAQHKGGEVRGQLLP